MITLGLSGGFGHDAAACVVRGGEVVCVVEEERVSRFKGAYGQPPVQAALAALRGASIAVSDVDVVAFGWDPALDPGLAQMAVIREATVATPELRALRPRRTQNFDHHLCHAATAVAAAPSSNLAIVVIDGRGERAATSIYRYDAGKLALIADFDVVDSIGSFFSAATRFAGFPRGGEGKLMGLASYGSAEPLDAFLLSNDGYVAAVPMPRRGPRTERHAAVRQRWFDYFRSLFGPPRVPDPSTRVSQFAEFQRWANFAAAIQGSLTKVVHHVCDVAARAAKTEMVALTGGVGLNCATNGSLRAQLGKRLALYAAMGDAGTAIGAGLLADDRALRHASLGSAYLGLVEDDLKVRRSLTQLGLTWTEPADLAKSVAELIGDGQLVGWVQGRAEIGPRALGHRSILGTADSQESGTKLNRLKQRESWRPLAPSLLAEEAERLFGVWDSPYMLEAVRATEAAMRAVPAGVHIDGTSRIHTLSDFTHMRFKALMLAIRDLSGTGGCLNTSFNVGREPIVQSTVDAVRTFFGSELDALAIGPALLRK